MRFYGQRGEDRIAFRYLYGFHRTSLKRTFLDIGAYDGLHLSNTRVFEELGWEGICIEADRSAFQSLRNNRHCTCLHLAASDREGEVELLSEPGRPMGTIAPKAADRLRESWHFRDGGPQIVPCKTVDQILTEQEMAEIDFVSLDVDGGEVEVLRGFDLRRAGVKLMCVETNMKMVRAGKWPAAHVREIDRIMTNQGYRLLQHHYANSFYVRDRFPWLTRMWLRFLEVLARARE